ncbi:MAG: OmpA family protein [Desulfobacterales bacterium]|nr:MAG: OmpA family protein [Desulfobacterales bacterium]
MYKKSAQLTMVLSMILVFIVGGTVQAGEIIYNDDIRENVVKKEVLEKAVDNVIVLVDTSSSMAAAHKKYQKTYYELEKEALAAGYSRLPDLGFNVGVYRFTPWSVVYPMQKFDAAAVAEAMQKLPAEPAGRTPLLQGMDELESVLKGLSGKTAVYIFSDGGYDKVASGKDPADKAAALAEKYDVCFLVIDYSRVVEARKMVADIARANQCSRVIPFDSYVTQPYYALGPLYYSKWDTEVETTSEKKVAGYKVNNILFEFDKYDLPSAAQEELNGVGKFLQEHPEAFAALFGYTDDTGKAEYNMELSRRRAEAVADYLSKNFDLDSERVVANWYGAANPIASNDTAEGRAQNRRVELSIGGM